MVESTGGVPVAVLQFYVLTFVQFQLNVVINCTEYELLKGFGDATEQTDRPVVCKIQFVSFPETGFNQLPFRLSLIFWEDAFIILRHII